MRQAKKSEHSNLEKKRKTLLVTGLMFASCLSLIFLEWASFEAKATQQFTYEIDFIPVETPPVVIISAKKKIEKPKPKSEYLIEIVDEITKEEEIPFEEMDLDDEEIELEDISFNQEDYEEDDIPFIIVEEKPVFIGGMNELNNFIAANTNYPRMAVDASAEGTVFIQFIIGKDGSIENAQLASSNGKIRKVGFGCDEEALRVIKQMPKWKPGKQRGKAVRVQFTLPVHFKLN